MSLKYLQQVTVGVIGRLITFKRSPSEDRYRCSLWLDSYFGHCDIYRLAFHFFLDQELLSQHGELVGWDFKPDADLKGYFT